MGRAPCGEKNGLKKGPWTAEEDFKLTSYIEEHGPGHWRTLPIKAGLERCGKSCRLRWTNYLRPDIKRGRFSFEEEETIIQLHSVLGNKWSAIAARLPGRTDNEIKNYWNTHIRKRLLRMGVDPVTHTPKFDHLIGSSSAQLNLLSNLLVALNQQQQQQHLLMTLSDQRTPHNNKVVLGSCNNISEPLVQDHTSWQQLIVDQSNADVDHYPFLYQLPRDCSSLLRQPQLNAMQPDNALEGLLSAEMGGYGFEVAGQGSHNYNQPFTFNSASLTSSTSSALNSSPFTDNQEDCSSFFNFEIPQGIDMRDRMR